MLRLASIHSFMPSIVAMQALQDTRAIYLNGCLFDELPSDMVLSALLQAKNGGAVICIDPGPRYDMQPYQELYDVEKGLCYRAALRWLHGSHKCYILLASSPNWSRSALVQELGPVNWQSPADA